MTLGLPMGLTLSVDSADEVIERPLLPQWVIKRRTRPRRLMTAVPSIAEDLARPGRGAEAAPQCRSLPGCAKNNTCLPRHFTRDQDLGQHQAAHAHATIEVVIHANSPSRRVRVA